MVVIVVFHSLLTKGKYRFRVYGFRGFGFRAFGDLWP